MNDTLRTNLLEFRLAEIRRIVEVNLDVLKGAGYHSGLDRLEALADEDDFSDPLFNNVRDPRRRGGPRSG